VHVLLSFISDNEKRGKMFWDNVIGDNESKNFTVVSNSTVINSGVNDALEETKFELYHDLVLGVAFLVTTIISLDRLYWSRKQGGPETTVVTAFYSLILMTSFLRTMWFLVPTSMLQPSYTPTGVMAFDAQEYPHWVRCFGAEVLVSLGSLCLFSIFILILVYWADVLKKYFFPGARRSKPMTTFLSLVNFLIVVELLNAAAFLLEFYSIEGMILVNAVFLSIVSGVCVYEISFFSCRFRTVVRTLGAINQVSTESQIRRIVWLTVTGNLFFITRAILETILCVCYVVYWHRYGTIDMVFSHPLWDTYILLKHWSELVILCLMLYILRTRFTSSGSPGTSSISSQGNRAGYGAVPDTVDVSSTEDSPVEV